MTTASLRCTLHHVTAHVAARQAFTAGPLVGRTVLWVPETGQLPHEYVLGLRADIEEARVAGGQTYVVSSYSTPIAWTRPDGTLVIPEERYSATTSKHQYHVRQAAA
jgi:hypothetical protein